MVDRKWCALTLLGALGACEVPLPSGSYDAAPISYVDSDAAKDAAGPTGTDVGFEAGAPVDAGPVDVLNPDAGNLTAEQARQLALAGDYLVRADLFDTATASRFGATVTVRSRASVMMLMRVDVSQSAGLVATERFCWQTYKLTCTSGCTDNTPVTTVDPASYVPMWGKTVARSLTLAPSSLAITGAASVHAVGYDGSQDDALPSAGDPRVYALAGGGQGFRTESSIRVLLVGPKNCTSDGVTRYATSFSGTLGGSADAPTFAGGTYTLDRSAVDGRQLAYGDNPDCRDDGSAASSQTKAPVLRIVPAPSGVPQGDGFFSEACPDAARWDELLPPAAP
jgi:hypothetical protein